MSEKIILHGRPVVGGKVTAEALVTKDYISGWGGVSTQTGEILEVRHELRGQSFKGKILVFPGAKGSSGWSLTFHIARLNGCAPAGMIFNVMNTKMGLGAVVVGAPAVTDLDRDPIEVIRTGDIVTIDGDTGTVEIERK